MGEQNWPLSTYMTPRAVRAAFGKPLTLPAPVSVAPNQPYGGGIRKAWALVTAAFFAVGIAKCASAPASEKLRQHFTVPMNAGTQARASDASAWPPNAAPPSDLLAGSNAAPAEAPGAVMFSNKFQLDGGR